MEIKKFNSLIEELRVQHLPNGSAELLNIESLQSNALFEISTSLSQMIIEKKEDVVLISKITPKVVLKLKVLKSSYNLGILKNVAYKMSHQLRSNVIFPT